MKHYFRYLPSRVWHHIANLYEWIANKGHYCNRCQGVHERVTRCRDVPRALAKATVDQFDYALQVRTGIVLQFASAHIHGDWVLIHEFENCSDHGMIGYSGSGMNEFAENSRLFDRGVWVRLADIVWVADAPHGS